MADNEPTPIRPGIRTTEFWLTMIVTIAALVPSLGLPDAHPAVKIAGVIMAVAAQLGYTAFRTAAKDKK